MKRLTIATLLISGSLMAAMGQNMPSFADFDANKDGKLTQKEFEYSQQERMKTKAEAGKMMKNAGNAANFSDIDTNGDGVVTRNEFQNHQKIQMQNNMMQKNGMGQGMGKCSGQGMGNGMGAGMGQGKNK